MAGRVGALAGIAIVTAHLKNKKSLLLSNETHLFVGEEAETSLLNDNNLIGCSDDLYHLLNLKPMPKKSRPRMIFGYKTFKMKGLKGFIISDEQHLNKVKDMWPEKSI